METHLNWEEEFSKLYNISLYRNDESELKAFIRKVEEAAYGRGRLEESKAFNWALSEAAAKGKAQALDSLREKVEGMKKPPFDWTRDEHGKKCVDGCTYCCYAEGQNVGRNTALTDILTEIQAMKKGK